MNRMAGKNRADMEADKENQSGLPRASRSIRRPVEVPRADNGFGFTLRHFIVYPPDSSKPGMVEEEDCETLDVAIEGGGKRKRSRLSDPMDTIFVKQVKDDGPAHHAGLRNGDRIVSVNGETVTGKTYSQVIELIQASDASLKLLVVAKDDDVLQMAYESSAYNPVPQDPYSGQASYIPEPPSLYPQGHPLTRTTDPPPYNRPRYKSELRVKPGDDMSPRASLTSLSSNGSVGGKDCTGVAGGEVYPPAPNRTSSKNFTLAQHQYGGGGVYSGSTDSISRSSDSSSHLARPSDDAHKRPGGDLVYGSQERLLRTSGENSSRGRHHTRCPSDNMSEKSDSTSSSGSASRLPFTTRPIYQPPPYSRSKTTSLLPGASSLLGAPISEASSGPRSAHSLSAIPGSVNQPVLPSSGSQSSQSSEARNSYGLMASYQPKRASSSDPQAARIPTRHSVPEQDMINLVTERKKKFENADYTKHRTRALTGPQRDKLPPRYGHDGVDSRRAQFDNIGGSDENMNSTEDDRGVLQTRPPSEIHAAPTPATISLYIRGTEAYSSKASMEPSPERTINSSYNMDTDQRRSKPAARQPSYLTAVDPPAKDTTSSEGRALRPVTLSIMNNSNNSHRNSRDLDHVNNFGGSQGRILEEDHDRGVGGPRYYYQGHSTNGSQGHGTNGSQGHGIIGGQGHGANESQGYGTNRNQGHGIGQSRGISGGQGHVDGDQLRRGPPPPYEWAVQSAGVGMRHRRQHLAGGVGAGAHGYNAKYSDLPPSSSTLTTSTTTTSTTSTTVTMREPMSAEERDMRLVRRTSYLMATGRQNQSPVNNGTSYNRMSTPAAHYSVIGHSHHEAPPTGPQAPPTGPQVPPPLIGQQQAPPTGALPTEPPSPGIQSFTDTGSDCVSVGEDPDDPALHSSVILEGMPHSASSLAHSDKYRKASLDLPRNVGGGTHSRESSRSPKETRARTLSVEISTPAKTSNIKKLKAFFGERSSSRDRYTTPRIVEATSGEKRGVYDLVGANLQTNLSCKVAVTDGKKASDRSWKPVWAVLRGHELHLYKDKSNMSPSGREEGPLSVRGSKVHVASDYTKKKHVFRLTTAVGSEYLLQADDEEVMQQWITAIEEVAQTSPDHEEGVTLGSSSSDLMKPAVTDTCKTSPQMAPKMKKTSSRSLRSKSPASHSPAKPRKQLPEKEYVDSPKTKDQGKTWKGKMAKKFKRNLSSSSTSADVPEVTEVTGTFSVPIELCPSSSYSENVPLVVEICTTIVESRGLLNQGIYRVPGNTGAVNMLQQELDRDAEGVDLDNEKWQDVNVVSSLLKSFFRKLPEPLITDELYEAVINANRTEHPEKRMLKLKKLLHDLPECNFETFRLLANHLNKVSDYGDVNKMDARNLAIVFGPTLIRPCDDSMVLMVRDMSDQCRIIESIVTHSRWFFSSWDEDVNVPVDEELEGAMPVSGMNQQLLQKAENLELGERGRDISAKELVTSILSAANKKIRKKDKTRTGESVDTEIEVDGSSFNERNIDREIELRRVKELCQPSTKDATSRSNDGGIKEQQVMRKESAPVYKEVPGVQKEPVVMPKVASSSCLSTPAVSSVPLQMSQSTAQMSTSMVQEPPPTEQKRSMSTSHAGSLTNLEERQKNWPGTSANEGVKRYRAYPATSDFYSFSKKSDEVTQQHFKRLEYEAKILRQRELEEERRQEQLVAERLRVEDEISKTRRELEEDSDVDTRCNADTRSVCSDTKSLASTSDYSTMTSTMESYNGANRTPELVSSKPASPFQRHNIVVKTPKKRCYLTTSTAPKISGPPRDDLELCRHNRPTNGSSLQYDTRTPGREGGRNVEEKRDIKLQRVGSIQRKASLDSLLEVYDQSSLPSELSCPVPHQDSDSSEDLLESIASSDPRFRNLLMSDRGSPSEDIPNKSRESQSPVIPKVGAAPTYDRKSSISSDKTSESSSPSLSLKTTPRGPPLMVRRPAAIPKSSPKTDLSCKPVLHLPVSKDTSEVQETSQGRSAKSASPAPRARADAREKRARRNKWRRHTLGGVTDLEELYNAVKSAEKEADKKPNAEPIGRLSAWERLRPAVKDDSGRDLQCWLAQQHRLKHAGSSPALLDDVMSPPPPPPRTHSHSSPTSPLHHPTPQHTFTFESSI